MFLLKFLQVKWLCSLFNCLFHTRFLIQTHYTRSFIVPQWIWDNHNLSLNIIRHVMHKALTEHVGKIINMEGYHLVLNYMKGTEFWVWAMFLLVWMCVKWAHGIMATSMPHNKLLKFYLFVFSLINFPICVISFACLSD